MSFVDAGVAYEKMISDEKLVGSLQVRFERFKVTLLKENQQYVDKIVASISPYIGDVDFPDQSIKLLFSIASGIPNVWAFGNRGYSAAEKNNLEKQAKKLLNIADKLKDTPYKKKVADIAIDLQAEIEHEMSEIIMDGRLRSPTLKSFTIIRIWEQLINMIPISSDSTSSDNTGFSQSQPNQEIAQIVSYVISNNVSPDDVRKTIKQFSTRRKVKTIFEAPSPGIGDALMLMAPK